MYLNELGLEGLDFIQKTQNLEGRWAVVNTVMNLPLS